MSLHILPGLKLLPSSEVVLVLPLLWMSHWSCIVLPRLHALTISALPGKKDEEYRHLMGLFGVSGELAMRPIASLSGGQKSRLAFALMAVPE